MSEGLNDIALPDLAELQIPSEFDLFAFGESGLLSDPPSLIVHDEAAEPHASDHLSWLPPATPAGCQFPEEAAPSNGAQEPQALPSVTGRAAPPKGKMERKAEQNRCRGANRAGCKAALVPENPAGDAEADTMPDTMP